MLVLSRKQTESVVIAGNLRVTVLEVHGDRVKFGFEGPADVPIQRHEVWARMREQMQTFEYAECA